MRMVYYISVIYHGILQR